MDRLCFGTFAKTLQCALQKPNSNQAVVELLLDLVVCEASDSELSANFSISPKMVSGLINSYEDVHSDVVALSSSDKVIEAMPTKFENNVVFVPMLIDDLIENLRQIIMADQSISVGKRDELVGIADKKTLTEFLAATYLYALNKSNKAVRLKADMEIAAELTPTDDIALLKSIYAKFPRPRELPVPDEPTDEELEYIAQLLEAYAEAAGVSGLSRADLRQHPTYNRDLRQRRKEYYAAETIRRGTREVFKETDSDQFELLKEETYDGIFDTHAQDYIHGYERLLRVMAQVAAIQINKSFLSELPEWIGNKEKKGVCHILVNDGKISWVVHDE